MTDTPMRPQWNHEPVKEEAAKLILGEVLEWAKEMGAIPEDADEKTVLAILTLAIFENADHYFAARYLEDHCQWPVNGELIEIIEKAYRSMPRLTTRFVHDWVMQNKVRFPAKEGQEIKFKVGSVDITGTVVGVVAREARGFVEVKGSTTPKHVKVLAEDVVKVFKTPRPSSPTPPTGGTPAASRSGAQLQKVGNG